ncbi:MAG: hypothetical protein ACREQ7_04555 [Candidatus Binatia bacterium]
MNLANHDLRAWMGEVESINQLHRIQGIPWDKDLGGLLEMILERSKHPPALLFENMPDARQDMQILCSQIDTIERLALAMGTDPKLGVTQCRPGAYLGRYVVVVDDDVDIYNPDDVIWAIATRSEPENIDIIRRAWSGPLDPAIPVERKGFNSRALIDATRPYEWRDKFPAVNAVGPELKAELDKKYASLLEEVLQRAH